METVIVNIHIPATGMTISKERVIVQDISVYKEATNILNFLLLYS